MAQVIVTIPDVFAPRVLAAFAKNYRYPVTVTDPDTGEQKPNPETPFQFAAKQRIKFLKDNVKAAEVPDLALGDRAVRIAEIDAVEITISMVP